MTQAYYSKMASTIDTTVHNFTNIELSKTFNFELNIKFSALVHYLVLALIYYNIK